MMRTWPTCKPALHGITGAYEREQSAADRQVYADAENAAKHAQLGLWHDLVRVAPWDWRHLSR